MITGVHYNPFKNYEKDNNVLRMSTAVIFVIEIKKGNIIEMLRIPERKIL